MEKGQKVRVIRGLYADSNVVVDRPHDSFPNFYWCMVERMVTRWKRGKKVLVPGEPQEALLNAGQIEKR
ncbi:hypothetical protein GCM10011378_07110 [Hymenobacter glacieicola]|uniref:Uncharacterized protein n=1 Tax=Hymenobacter glacieicola TaxID=1562124 RepID=A0ABQ1WJQ0_9BACT|nr:hypothetical protein GCM10011378_07110 [Hymenobacter glacieicola]